MNRRTMFGLAAAALAGLAGAGWLTRKRGLSPKALAARYAEPLAPPDGPMACYHLGHSLVGRDMPAMLAQLGGHAHASQLGWGASLQDHWRGQVKGFETENAHPAHRPVREALASGAYGAVILTEMVELKDAIRWHKSGARLADWAHLAWAGNPAARVYLYETWHRLDDATGWLARLDGDLAALWEAELLRPAMSQGGTIHLIPGGQVMAAAVRAIEAGQVPGLTRREDLFTDQIHMNDIAAWLMAMTHYAVIYHRSPVGLPAQLARADGTSATPPGPEAANRLQEVVWQVVTRYPATGVRQG